MQLPSVTDASRMLYFLYLLLAPETERDVEHELLQGAVNS